MIILELHEKGATLLYTGVLKIVSKKSKDIIKA